MKGGRTTGWLGSDYNKISKAWLWIWRNVDSLVLNKFNTALVDTTKYKSKIKVITGKSTKS